jgi:ATP-dependent protease HslVU (ClpYQ) peptidase subunit
VPPEPQPFGRVADTRTRIRIRLESFGAMTIICAVEDATGVVMACDEQSSTWNRRFHTEPPKLFRNGEYLFGICGDWRMAQLLQYGLEPPPVRTWDVDRHIATVFVDAVRECFQAGGYERQTDGAASIEGSFLVAVKRRVYHVESNYQFNRSASGTYSMGSGEDVAIGAMHALQGQDAESRVRAGVDAAIEHTTGCGYGIRIEWAY